MESHWEEQACDDAVRSAAIHIIHFDGYEAISRNDALLTWQIKQCNSFVTDIRLLNSTKLYQKFALKIIKRIVAAFTPIQNPL